MRRAATNDLRDTGGNYWVAFCQEEMMNDVEIFEALVELGADMCGLDHERMHGLVVWRLNGGQSRGRPLPQDLMDAAAMRLAKQRRLCIECHTCGEGYYVNAIDWRKHGDVEGQALTVREAFVKAVKEPHDE